MITEQGSRGGRCRPRGMLSTRSLLSEGSMTEAQARSHEAFIDFKAYCDAHASGIHPDDNEFCYWEPSWRPFVSGWNARKESCE